MADPYRFQAEAAFFVPNFERSHKQNQNSADRKGIPFLPAFIPSFQKIFFHSGQAPGG